MRLVVGLGNPGLKYAWTRHNIGWLMIDTIVNRLSLPVPQMKFKGELWDSGFHKGERIALLKPHTFMNLSGDSVSEAAKYMNVKPSEMLIIYDDTALPFGKFRIRTTGSAGGHNGMKSIIAQEGTLDIPRLRIGVGQPENGQDMASWVLGKFTAEQRKSWDKLEDMIWDAFDVWMTEDIQNAMNKINTFKI